MNHTIHTGNCLEIMREMPSGSYHAFITDPPYTAAGGSTNGRNGSADDQFFTYWMKDVCDEMFRVTRDDGCGFAFCDWRTLPALQKSVALRNHKSSQTARAWSLQQVLVWDRESIGLGSPFRNSFEMIAFFRGPDFKSELPKNIPTVVRHRWPYGRHEHHGAEKPVGLLAQLIIWATWGFEPARIIDPFMGSGSTLVAAAQLSEVYAVGIEMEEGNIETAKARLADSQGKARFIDFDPQHTDGVVAPNAKLTRPAGTDVGAEQEPVAGSVSSALLDGPK